MPIDPQTARCLRELRDTIKAIESGAVALRRYADVLTEEDGLHREIALKITFLPQTSKAKT